MPSVTKTNRVSGEDTLRVLLYDLETSPNIGYTWGTHETDVIKVIYPRQIISIAWKWLGEEKVHVLSLTHFPGYKKDRRDNRRLMEAIHKLFSQADIVVGHNVKRFDDRRAHTDFIKHGLKPPPPHRQVDTLEFARFKFDFNSNRLGDLGEFLGLGGKVKHPGFEMWEGCLNGDPKSWALMEKYNRGDVELLERVYLKLRPWMMKHPSLNPVDRAVFACPSCRSPKLHQRGSLYTSTGKRPRFQCQDCGKWAKGQIVKRELRIQ